MAKTQTDNVLLATVTHYFIGTLEEETDTFYVLKDAIWVYSLGRLGEALIKGTVQEYETVGRCQITKGSLVARIPWDHPIPA